MQTKQLKVLSCVKDSFICAYRRDETSRAFVCAEYDKGDRIMEKCGTQHNYLIICMEGSFLISSSIDDFSVVELQTSEMVIIPAMSIFQMTALDKGKILYLIFDEFSGECDSIFLHNYYQAFPATDSGNGDNPSEPLYILPVHTAIRRVAEDMLFYIDNGKTCSILHDLKARELLIAMRWFYSHDEIKRFIFPIISKASFSFRHRVNKIMNEATSYEPLSLDEVIMQSGMSRSSFMRKFKEEFRMTPYQWMQNIHSKRILNDIIWTEMSVKEIMHENSFSSYSNFNRFCRKHLNASPQELIRKHRKEGCSGRCKELCV